MDDIKVKGHGNTEQLYYDLQNESKQRIDSF